MRGALPLVLTFFWTLRWARSVPVYDGPYVPASSGSRPSCARETVTFCENVDKYPTELIKSLIQQKTLQLTDVLTDEREGLHEPPGHVVSPPTRTPPARKISRKVRSVDENPPNDVCPKHRRTVIASPKAAMNIQGEWRYVVDGQFFKLNICSERIGESCTNMNMTCNNTFAMKPMLALDPSGKLSNDRFVLPRQCTC